MQINLVKEQEAVKVMEEIGCEKTGINIMKPKTIFKLIRINSVRNSVANMLKQEMLSAGGDCAVNKDTINCKIERTDVLLMGTLQQYRIVIKKMRIQPPEDAKEIADELEEFVGWNTELWTKN